MADVPMANGHLEPGELALLAATSAAHHPDPPLPNGPHVIVSSQPQQWRDIQAQFAEWSREIHPGELLSTPAFTLYDAMSAIELMDVKMDIGLSLKDRKIKSFEDGVVKGLMKLEGFSSSDYLAVMDRSLPFVIMWMQGHCVAQTVFTLLYLHKPEALRDELMHAYCVTLLELIDHVRQIMLDGGVVEEEDFQVMSPISIPNLFNDPSKPRSALSKSLKIAEETCARNARRLKSAASPAEVDEAARWNAIALRFKFLRTLVQFLSAFRWRSDAFFTEAPQQLEVLQTTLEKIVGGYFLDGERVLQAPGFEPLINLHLLPPSFPRHTPLTLGEETFVFMKRLVDGLKVVMSVRENVGKLDVLLGMLRKECGLSSLALIRSMMQIVISHSLGINLHSPHSYPSAPISQPPPWFLLPLSDGIMESIRVFTSAPVFLNSHLPQSAETTEYAGTFVRSCVTVFSNLLRVYGLNKARQRDALGVALVDVFTLQEDAEKLDDYFNQQLLEQRLPGFTHHFCLASWTLMTMLHCMSEYLLSGFELDLYAPTELHFVYWYLYDVLYHCEIQTVARADNAVRENETALGAFLENEARMVRKNGKKKPPLKSKTSDSSLNSRPHRGVLARAQSLHYLCGAYQLTVLGLQMQGKIRPSDDSLDNEEFRYYNRLMPFMERNAPAFVDYEHYCAVRSVLCEHQLFPGRLDFDKNNESNAVVMDIFRRASQNIQNAEKLFPYWADEDQKVRLTKVCRRNDVILKILATGRNCKSVELVHDEHPWFPSLKLV
ncbi:N-alpha-acetyltransferase 35, NatC auxiliary subunit-like [Paramacrobiotus metropolitanus]|uniref:N-alpha-acetyltransferase 35, NatC auxiliary subunit-like n=1 Tax=Paramacrobiotus metropolitanus TaxID=2943436 RepID=UPI002445B266|nr:N-alpha-acetyltransferase 35, NatC auxiliary subunit-like [Paramacrobiotus metropolitanus]